MTKKKFKNIQLGGLVLFVLSWIFFVSAYALIWLEINLIYLPLIMAVTAILTAFSSLILATICLFKGELIILNITILVFVILTIAVLYTFIKFYSFFVNFSG